MRKVKQAKAMQQYECHLCGRHILRGNQYIVETRKDDLGYKTLHRHIHCDAMLEAHNRFYGTRDCYARRQITETLYGKLCVFICDEEKRGECEKEDLFSCELCQKRILSPSIMSAVKESVRDNYEY